MSSEENSRYSKLCEKRSKPPELKKRRKVKALDDMPKVEGDKKQKLESEEGNLQVSKSVSSEGEDFGKADSSFDFEFESEGENFAANKTVVASYVVEGDSKGRLKEKSKSSKIVEAAAKVDKEADKKSLAKEKREIAGSSKAKVEEKGEECYQLALKEDTTEWPSETDERWETLLDLMKE